MKQYRKIIDNWQAFKEEAGGVPLNSVRKNPLKAGEDFEERLSRGFNFEKAGWNPNIYRLDTKSPGKSALHWRGEYYVQEESATVPVDVLNPRPNEKVLDMCAAPGGKTTQIAAQMSNNGLVIANDTSSQRMKSLHANIYRTGSSIVEAVNYDARNMPEKEFDRILVDAPCSGEGDRYRRDFSAASKEESQNLSELQFQLLEKASRMLKEGGTIVYSTCTINPLENEAVVDKAVKETTLDLERSDAGIEHVRGVNEFEEASFEADMRKNIRVYPHHVNSGVIFVAKLRK